MEILLPARQQYYNWLYVRSLLGNGSVDFVSERLDIDTGPSGLRQGPSTDGHVMTGAFDCSKLFSLFQAPR